MRLNKHLVLVFSILLSLVSASSRSSGSEHCSDGARTDAVEAQRQAFNQAIEKADLETIAMVLADDVLLITGTDSDRYAGESAQLALWDRDFGRVRDDDESLGETIRFEMGEDGIARRLNRHSIWEERVQ